MKLSFGACRSAILGSLAVVCAGLVGCEWESTSDSYNSRYNFVNFSGVYRGVNGGLLVTDYSSEVATPAGEGAVASTNNITGETTATCNGSDTVYAGRLDQNNVVPGTLSITGGGFTFSDVDADGNLESTGGAFGFINYSTGQWSVDFNGVAPADGVNIRATYAYIIEAEDGGPSAGTGSGQLGNATSGASGAEIYAFTVEQYGNLVNLIDNNGRKYEGKFGDVRSTSGVNQDDAGSGLVAAAGDSFIAKFEANGVSAAGKQVNIVGNFQGVVSSVSGRSGVLDARQLFATWIEENGRTGNVTGQASPITITLTPQSTVVE